MGTYFHLTAHLAPAIPRRHQPAGRQAARTASSAGTLAFGRKSLSATMLVLLCGMGLLYLALVNVRVTKGFQIKTLEKQLAELGKQQQELRVVATELQSIQQIQKSVDLGQFIPTKNVEFIQPANVALSDQ